MLFGAPIILILLFGFALTNEIKNAKVVVCDYANNQSSQIIINKLAANKQFKVERILLSHTQIEAAFKKENIKLVIVFPANFQKDLFYSKQAQIQIIADGSDPNTGNMLTNFATAVIMNYQKEITGGDNTPYAVDITTRMLYNPELKGTTNFVPGVMTLVLTLICVMMTAVSIVREKESGTMEVLLVSPFNPLLVLISKSAPYLLLSLINLTVILLLSVFLLEMPVNGSIVLFFLVSTLFIITVLSLGLLISTLTQSQEVAMLIALLGMMLPVILLTGFMFPLENMPMFFQVLANILPSKWYYIIVKSIIIKGLGFFSVWKETLILLGMTIFLLAVSLKKFKIRLA